MDDIMFSRAADCFTHTYTHTHRQIQAGSLWFGWYEVSFLSWWIATSAALCQKLRHGKNKMLHLSLEIIIHFLTLITDLSVSSSPLCSLPHFLPDVHPDKEECVSVCVLRRDSDSLNVSAELDDSVFKKVWNPLKHTHTHSIHIYNDMTYINEHWCQMVLCAAAGVYLCTFLKLTRMGKHLLKRVLSNRLGNTLPFTAWQGPEENQLTGCSTLCMYTGS